ncbi:hypothetical protein RJ639_033642, partial [Escallonia herrerae]
AKRSLEETPTWSVAVVCFVLVAISIIIEHLIHVVASWLKNKHKRALYEALEKIKSELMLLGFISLLLTVGQDPISKICIPKSVGTSWHPCQKDRFSDSEYEDSCAAKLHIFIFVLAVFHVLYCIITLGLGRLKMRKWKAWEDETKTTEYRFYNDPDRFRFARETTFGRRHLSFWSKSSPLLWTVCFFRQFVTSVAKVDYLTLRHGFITAHLAPQSEVRFDFQKYISRSLEDDFKVVVGISPVLWFSAVLFLLTNTHAIALIFTHPPPKKNGADSQFRIMQIILLVGTKLQVIITKMGVRAQEKGVIRGIPVVEPGDDLFWFDHPRFILFLINFVLFLNAFQMAFFMWSWYEFGLRSCYHKHLEDIIIRLSMGFIIQFLCSYVTFPLYALVTQMGSAMKPIIFSDQVATALRNWHQTAKKHRKHRTSFSSRPATPMQRMSPVHLLHSYQNTSAQSSPRTSNADNEPLWGSENILHNHDVNDETSRNVPPSDPREHEVHEPISTQLPPAPNPICAQHEIEIGSARIFSFADKR